MFSARPFLFHIERPEWRGTIQAVYCEVNRYGYATVPLIGLYCDTRSIGYHLLPWIFETFSIRFVVHYNDLVSTVNT